MTDFTLQRRRLDALPETAQHKMMRRGLNIDPCYPQDIQFSIARSPEDLKAACEILYTGYTGAGFMEADGSGYRFTVYHALPFCYTLIAKQANEVIATVTLIVRSSEPLPIEHIFSIDAYLGFGRRAIEVSALTIHPKLRGNKGRVLFPLIKYLIQFAKKQLGGTDLVITCNPKHLAFYKAILLFESVSNDVKASYDFVDGAPAVAARLDLTDMPRRYGQVYKDKPPHKDLYDYIVVNSFPQCGISERAETVYYGNHWPPDQLDWILETLAIGRSKLSLNDVRMLRRSYGASYDTVFNRLKVGSVEPFADGRTDLNMDAVVVCGHATFDTRLISLSGDALLLSIDAERLPINDGVFLDLQRGSRWSAIPLKLVRSLENNEFLFAIRSSDRHLLLEAIGSASCDAASFAAE